MTSFRFVEAFIERCCTQVGLRVSVALGARLLLVRQGAEGEERREAHDAGGHGVRHRVAKAQRGMFRRTQVVCADGCNLALLYCVLYCLIVCTLHVRDTTLHCMSRYIVRLSTDLSFLTFTEYGAEVSRNANRVMVTHKAFRRYAIIQDQIAQYEGTKKRIEGAFETEKHLKRAIEIAPTDSVALHSMGVWHFEVSVRFSAPTSSLPFPLLFLGSRASDRALLHCIYQLINWHQASCYTTRLNLPLALGITWSVSSVG